MNNNQTLRTGLPEPADLQAAHIRSLTDLINAVYDEAESGMWKRPGTRTNVVEVERLLRDNRLILAKRGGGTVGSVNVNLMEEGVGEFGMLVADRHHRGKGIGSALVSAAEDWARDIHCHTMRLELLTPRTWKHPSKELAAAWYRRIGYQPQHTEPFEALYPDLAPELATECDFTVWLKAL